MAYYFYVLLICLLLILYYESILLTVDKQCYIYRKEYRGVGS